MSRMDYRPHPYQERMRRWVVEHPRCLLFAEMGLGKTVVTLTALQDLVDSWEVSRVLVVAPAKVAESTWSDEAEKWSHLRLRVTAVKGTPEQRRRQLADGAEVHVISRDSFVWLCNEWEKGQCPFDTVVIDELTGFKAPSSLRGKAMRRLSPLLTRVIGLTGTPAPNGLMDLWGQVACVDCGERLGRFVTRYRQRWFDTVEHNHIVIRCTPKKGAEREIRERISDIALGMRTEDYLELPPMMVTDRMVELPEKTMRRYRQFEKDSVLEFKKATDGADRSVVAAGAAALMNKLSQMANGAVYAEDGTWVAVHDEKLRALDEVVEEAGGPVLCFYAYKHDLERITARYAGKMEVRKYEGAGDLADWNAGKIDLLLAHPASTAYGLNMQKGGHAAVWFSTGWNLELYDQANARLHRQGQEKPVTVVNLVARGTVDERMAAALRSKSDGQRAMMAAVSELVKDLG